MVENQLERELGISAFRLQERCNMKKWIVSILLGLFLSLILLMSVARLW